MSRKFFFFDIDGTLVDYQGNQHIIPNSTKEAIIKLQENGHIVAIASGRQIVTILPVMKECQIHHSVSDGGYGVIINDQVLHIDPIDPSITKPLYQELFQKKIPFGIMNTSTENKIYATNAMLQERKNVEFEDSRIVIDETFDYINAPAYKVFMNIEEGQEDILSTINLHKITRYVTNCLVYEPDDKYKGALEIVEYFHGKKEDIVFFGDSYNDLDMFDQVECSIAMGNAIDELKEKATFVTKNIDDDGIYYACKYFKWI